MMKNRLYDVSENVREVCEKIALSAIKANRNPKEVSLMAVTKTVSPEFINEAFKAGVCFLGENRVQEFSEKLPFYDAPKEKIHFIGHLQRNKIHVIIEKVGMIESVDSIRLAQALSAESEKRGIVTEILLQVNIGKEETKTGFFAEEVLDALKQISVLQNLKVSGLMAIPPRSLGKEYFPQMQELFLKCKEKSENFSVLSMGMSDDYEQAIAYGATEVRLGRALFGERVISKIL